jgi:hypothetical protein
MAVVVQVAMMMRRRMCMMSCKCVDLLRIVFGDGLALEKCMQ